MRCVVASHQVAGHTAILSPRQLSRLLHCYVRWFPRVRRECHLQELEELPPPAVRRHCLPDRSHGSPSHGGAAASQQPSAASLTQSRQIRSPGSAPQPCWPVAGSPSSTPVAPSCPRLLFIYHLASSHRVHGCHLQGEELPPRQSSATLSPRQVSRLTWRSRPPTQPSSPTQPRQIRGPGSAPRPCWPVASGPSSTSAAASSAAPRHCVFRLIFDSSTHRRRASLLTRCVVALSTLPRASLPQPAAAREPGGWRPRPA